MSDAKFKVVEDQQGRSANSGPQPKGYDHPLGLTQAEADHDAAERNERAEALGIRTRYEVVPL